MTTIRWSGGSRILLLALILGISLLPDIKSVAKPGEPSLGISEQRLERQENLVRLDFRSLFQSPRELQEKAERLTPPSGLPEATPQPDPILADGVNTQEEINFLIELYAAKYGVAEQTLERIVEAESRHNPEATGSEGERGLGQFLSSTWLTMPQGKKYGWDAAWHPAVNIEAIAWMLSQGRIGEFHAIR